MEERKTRRVAENLNGRSDWFRREKRDDGSGSGSDPASGNGYRTQDEGFEKSAPHWKQVQEALVTG